MDGGFTAANYDAVEFALAGVEEVFYCFKGDGVAEGAEFFGEDEFCVVAVATTQVAAPCEDYAGKSVRKIQQGQLCEGGY